MSITKSQHLFVVGKGTKLQRTFTSRVAAEAYRDAMSDMKKAGLL